MEIIFHRGAEEIGGNILEVRSRGTTILLDVGEALPGPEGTVSCGVELPACDAVFITHYHADHCGLMDSLPKGTPVYMGDAAYAILKAARKHMQRKLNREECVQTLYPAHPVKVGELTITPLLVDHSALDSYMFLVEGEGKRLLYTGDFRLHGFRGGKVLPTIARYAAKVDLLVCEGTRLGADTLQTERELQAKARQLIQNTKYLYVLCASTNFDRMAAFYHATPRGKYFVCDRYQKGLLDICGEKAGTHSGLYAFPKALVLGDNLVPKLKANGFCMLVRANRHFAQQVKQFDVKHSHIVYSMWKGYLDREEGAPLREMMAHCPGSVLHTSGHADAKAIGALVDVVRPKQGVIFVHHNESLPSAKIDYRQIVLKNSEKYSL